MSGKFNYAWTRTERRLQIPKDLRRLLGDSVTEQGEMQITLGWEKVVRDQAIADGVIDDKYAFTAEDHNAMEAERIGSMMGAAFAHLDASQKAELAKMTYKQALRFMNGSSLPELVNLFVKALVEQELKEREDEIRSRVTGEVNARWEAAVAKIVEAQLEKAIAKIKQEMAR